MSAQGTKVIPRSIDDLIPDVVIEENGNDDMEITQHPVEQGASITDHAFVRPALLSIHAGWSNSSLSAKGDPNYSTNIYQKLLDLRGSRKLITVVTGQRTYTNMLIRTIAKRTDQSNEFALMVSLTLQQIIIVQTQLSSLPSAPLKNQNVAKQAQPKKTGPTKKAGTKQVQPTQPKFPNVTPDNLVL